MLGSGMLQIPQDFAFWHKHLQRPIWCRPNSTTKSSQRTARLTYAIPSKASMLGQITASIGSLSGSSQDIPEVGCVLAPLV